jgi:hypothetical protein
LPCPSPRPAISQQRRSRVHCPPQLDFSFDLAMAAHRPPYPPQYPGLEHRALQWVAQRMRAPEEPRKAVLSPAVLAVQISLPTMDCQGHWYVFGLPRQPAFLSTENPRLHRVGWPPGPGLLTIRLPENCLPPADLARSTGFAVMKSQHRALLALRSPFAHFRHTSPDIEVSHLQERGDRCHARNSNSPLGRPRQSHRIHPEL